MQYPHGPAPQYPGLVSKPPGPAAPGAPGVGAPGLAQDIHRLHLGPPAPGGGDLPQGGYPVGPPSTVAPPQSQPQPAFQTQPQTRPGASRPLFSPGPGPAPPLRGNPGSAAAGPGLSAMPSFAPSARSSLSQPSSVSSTPRAAPPSLQGPPPGARPPTSMPGPLHVPQMGPPGTPAHPGLMPASTPLARRPSHAMHGESPPPLAVNLTSPARPHTSSAGVGPSATTLGNASSLAGAMVPPGLAAGGMAPPGPRPMVSGVGFQMQGATMPGMPQQMMVPSVSGPYPPPGLTSPGPMPGAPSPLPPPGSFHPLHLAPPGSLCPPQLAPPGPSFQRPPPSSAAPHMPIPRVRNDPRPCLSPQPLQVFETRRAGEHNPPPPVDLPIIVRDRGSCSPHLMRSTLNLVPQTPDLFRKLCVPFGAVITPLARLGPQDDAVPLVDFGVGGPPRCGSCRAYVNPHVRFVTQGLRMVCNLCGEESDVPEHYRCGLDYEGRRLDLAERPELLRGAVDLVATPEYCARAPAPPVHLFAVEVSAPALASGATHAACAAAAAAVQALAAMEAEAEARGEAPRARVGLLTFDSAVHFYDVGAPAYAAKVAERGRRDAVAGSSALLPPILVMPDIDEPFAPLPAAVTLPLRSHRAALEAALAAVPAALGARLEAAGDAARVVDGAGGAALSSAVAALATGTGGVVHAFVATLPRRGEPHSRPREAARPHVLDRDPLEALAPDAPAWTQLAERAAEAQVRVNVFLVSPQAHLDAASFAALCLHTGGRLRQYSVGGPLSGTMAAALRADAVRLVRGVAGLEAVGRLRVSAGVAVTGLLGAGVRGGGADVVLPALTEEDTVSATLAVRDKLQDKAQVSLQFALLYTSPAGQRRVRVLTAAYPVTAGKSSVYRGADMDAVLNHLARRLAAQLPGRAVGACRETAFQACVDTLVAYRQHAAKMSDPGQLLLPEAMQLLPLYALALGKTPLFRNDTPLDARAAWMLRLLGAPARAVPPAVYPRLLPIHPGLLELRAAGKKDRAVVPDALALTAAQVEAQGVYLLEDGLDAWVFLGRGVEQSVVESLIGSDRAPERLAAPGGVELPVIPDSPLNAALHDLLHTLGAQRDELLRVRVVSRTEQDETAFYSLLVEDKFSTAGMSYADFLRAVHRHIVSKLS